MLYRSSSSLSLCSVPTPCRGRPRGHKQRAALASARTVLGERIHVLVVPKGEYISFNDFMQNVSADFVGKFFASIQKVAASLGLEQGGYRLITNHGADAAQSVFHFHVHILGGRALGGFGLVWFYL